MLDQLVESRSHEEENLKRSGLLLVTFIIVSSLFLGGLVYSLFAKELGLSDEGLVLTTLVAPPLPEEAPPPPPEPEQKPEKQTTSTKETDVTIVKEAYATIEQTKEPPKDVLGQRDVMAIRPGERFKIGTENIRASSPSTGIERGEGGGSGLSQEAPVRVDDEEAPPPTPKPTPKPAKPVSKGVINGEAISLPQPPYPQAAKSVRASGDVTVQVTIDEEGNVISAVATSGHPLLRQAAVDAAKRAKFKPTLLSGVPVKATGIIIYKFILQ